MIVFPESFTDGKANPIVIDNGSLFSRSGFSGQKSPHEVKLTVVGHERIKKSWRTPFVGDKTLDRITLNLSYPVENGVITNFDDMELIWKDTLDNKLRVSPQDHPILLTETLSSPKINREKKAQIMFESFDVPALYLANQSLLSLYATGRTTGVVWESGDSIVGGPWERMGQRMARF